MEGSSLRLTWSGEAAWRGKYLSWFRETWQRCEGGGLAGLTLLGWGRIEARPQGEGGFAY